MKVDPKHIDPSIDFYMGFAKAFGELENMDTFSEANNLRLEIVLTTVVDTDYRRMAHDITVRMLDLGEGKVTQHTFDFATYEAYISDDLYYEHMKNIFREMYKEITEG